MEGTRTPERAGSGGQRSAAGSNRQRSDACPEPIEGLGVMADVVLVALTIAVFAVLALVVKAVGRL
ncbi:hypothetical protein GCM10009546_32510 [Actinomadura livida]|uniref:Uncharacterized protein n=1 Tax=Actinomadura livida TaxID=79909 RepID=A0ABP3PLQ9_9ACTN|nr:hypothetical protein GCM10010208_41510 [Actinomadura livida]